MAATTVIDMSNDLEGMNAMHFKLNSIFKNFIYHPGFLKSYNVRIVGLY